MNDFLPQVVEADCAVLGYLTQSDQLVVLVQSERGRQGQRGAAPGAVLRCYREAERLAGLFEQSAARLQAHLLLSAVMAVDLLPAPVTVPAPRASPGSAPVGGGAVCSLTVLLAGLALVAVVHLERRAVH